MMTEHDPPGFDEPDGDYFEPETRRTSQAFDSKLLQEPLQGLPTNAPILFAPNDSVTDAMRAMQREGRGCVLITEDGTADSQLIGIFSERDVLFRIVDRGRNPATLPIAEVMTRDPEVLPVDASIAWVLNKMALGGFRHVPVVDEKGHPVSVASVRDVVQFLVEFFPRDVLNLPPDPTPARFREREGA